MSAEVTTDEARVGAEDFVEFDARWLAMAGVPGEEVPRRVERARKRIRRYPWYIRLTRSVVVWAIVWFGPLFFLRSFRTVRSLSADAYAVLMRRLREHRRTTIRLAGLSAVAPLMEVIDDDEPPAQPDHPLDGRLDAHQPEAHTAYDLVVIGSGAGGAPVATRLAQAGARVAVVEKGGIAEPADTSTALERYYVNQGMFGIVRGTPIVVPVGSNVGGTTVVNSGTSLRPKKRRLEAWDAKLGTEFAAGALDPWLEAAEEAINVMVPREELRSTSAKMVSRGLDELGRPQWYGLPRNVDGCKGSGRCCFGCPTGAKQGTDRSFLPDALDAGADLWANWEATSIEERDSHVRVKIRGEERRRTLRCRRLVLSAGAIYTPGLIRKNRLGSHWLHAGRGFKTHPATKVFGYFPGLSRPEEFPGIPQGLGYRPPELERVTMEGAELPTTAVGPMFAAGGYRFRNWLLNHHHLVSYGAMISDRNSGRVREVAGQPVISYGMHPEDGRDLVRAMRLIGEVLFAAGAERILMPFPGYDNEFDSVDALHEFDPTSIPTDQLLLSGFHPQGTAGMGRIVDTDLKLRGSKRIWVSDASVLPDSPGVNPQVTIIALALRLAEQLGG